MVEGTYADKKQVVDILSKSFADNKSVNYVVKQDEKKEQRIRSLMEYAFEICFRFGKVYLSETKDACALVLLPDQKKTNLATIQLDAGLVFKSFGIANIINVLRRESKIKKAQATGLKYYLWFIGVSPDKQHCGLGSSLLAEIMHAARRDNRFVCLETSTKRNLLWYQKNGFEIYHTIDFGYPLYCLKS